MPLNFLNQLNDEAIIDLLNYVNNKNDFTNNHKVRFVRVFREPDRVDEDNNQQLYVVAMDGSYHFGNYILQDFTMRCTFEGRRNKKYNDALREYLTGIFGDIYLEALRAYYQLCAEKEINRIKETIGVSRH